jgi:hypothetical protein
MTTYKVYKKGNYIIFEYLNVTGAAIHTEEEAADLLYKRDANNLITLTSKRTEKSYVLKQGSVNNESDVAYTEAELETFLSANTGVSNSSSGGGGGAGDASAANQVITNTKLTSIDGKVATETTLSAINTKTATLVSGRVPVDGSGVTQPISAASLPLPTGAATASNQTSTNTKLDTLNAKDFATQTTLSLIKAKTDNLDVLLSTRTKPTDSQLVSGLSAVGVAPSLNPISISGIDGGGLKRHFLLDTNGKIETTLAQPLTDTQLRASALPLPSGAATSANQASTNNSLISIDGKLTPQFVSNTGTLSGATQVVNLPITSESAGTVQITGTWVGTITFEATLDGTTFYPINAVSASTSSPQTTTTVNGLYRLTPAGTLSFRANMTSFTSGTANILIRATNGVGGIFSNQVIPTILSSSQNALSVGIKATMTAYGYQRMTLEPKVQFADSFDGGTLEVTDKWTQTGTVSLSNSSALIGNITTTSTVNAIQSKPTFPSLGLSFQVLAWVGGFETSPLTTTNVNRFFGFHQHTSTPTLSQPATDGVGLEWDSITGKLWFAVYQSGVRSASSVDLSTSVISSLTRYAILYRSDLAICYIGSSEIPVATISFVTPSVQNLPIKFQTVIGASAPSVTPANTIQAVGCGDTGGNSTQLSDGTNPWRKAKIDASGNQFFTSPGIPASLGNQAALTSQPVTQSTESASGNITIINSVPNGVATAGSAVEITLNGASSLSIQTTGSYTGALSIQLTNDGTRWETITTAGIVNTITGAYTNAIASAAVGLFQFECGNFLRARVTALAAVTGTATVTIKASNSTSLVTIDNALPTGTNSIGNIGTVGTVTTVTALGSINTSVVPGVAATNLGKAEDAVAVSGDTGVFALGVRRDTLTVSASATGDYSEIAVDRYGNALVKDQTRHKRTYSAAFTVVPAATATDIFQLIGSATTTVSVNRITIISTQTTGAQVPFSLIKRSTANTGGTLTTTVNVPNDAADTASTAVGSIYTANPTTTGTVVGIVKSLPIFVGSTSTTNNIVDWNFGERGKPIVLSGITQAIAISLGNTTLAGGSISVNIEFTEE